jgi:hypothetical protein
MNGVRTVSSGAVNRPIPQQEYRQTCTRYRDEAQTAKSLPEIVGYLWRTEGFSTTFGKYRLEENTLNDPALPRESLPVAHVGYGAASTEYARFQPGVLHEIAETRCHPCYQAFMYEGIGSILRIYEPGFFKFMCGAMGLIPRGAPAGPDRTGFFGAFLGSFTPEIQRLITHGYGRLVAFSRLTVYAALREVGQLPPERVAPCVQGIAFAFAIMNSQEMARLLENSQTLEPAPVRAAFQNGLVYTLSFCEWFVPGTLAKWKAAGPNEERLTALAREEAARDQARGYPLAFQLEAPITA